MEKINSFDVFDTLIGRRYINNDIVFNSIEQISKVKNFAAERKAADDGNRSLLEIYKYLHQIGLITEQQIYALKQLEILYEISNIFPIKENIDKVKHGDLLVSDMYMSGPDILSLVRSVGLDKQVTIYQSNGDKRTGKFWEEARKNNLQIEMHYGDNALSDVINAKRFGFSATHFKDSIEVSQCEQFLRSQNLNVLSYLLREIRLSNSSKEHAELFDTANQINLPWLFFVCELIYRQYKGKHVVFLSRDCQLMYRIYSAFYEPCQYLPFSRKVVIENAEVAAKYLKNQIPEGAVIFDMSSTGKTWERICAFLPIEVSVVIFENRFYYSKQKPNLPDNFNFFITGSQIGEKTPMDFNTMEDCNLGLILEILNCGDHGYLSEIHEHGNVFLTKYGDVDTSKDIIDVIHKPVNTAINLSGNYASNIRSELRNLSVSDLMELVLQFIVQIYSQRFLTATYTDFINKTFRYNDIILELEKGKQ